MAGVALLAAGIELLAAGVALLAAGIALLAARVAFLAAGVALLAAGLALLAAGVGLLAAGVALLVAGIVLLAAWQDGLGILPLPPWVRPDSLSSFGGEGWGEEAHASHTEPIHESSSVRPPLPDPLPASGERETPDNARW